MSMNKDKDMLTGLFKQLPEEQLPADFRANLMRQIMAETERVKKRNERLELLAVILASLFILTIAVLALIYLKVPQMILAKPTFTIPPFYLYIGTLALILLGGDFLMRKKYKERHKE